MTRFQHRLLVALASDPATAAPTLQLLRSQCGGLAALVPSVVCAPLPEQVRCRLLGFGMCGRCQIHLQPGRRAFRARLVAAAGGLRDTSSTSAPQHYKVLV